MEKVLTEKTVIIAEYLFTQLQMYIEANGLYDTGDRVWEYSDKYKAMSHEELFNTLTGYCNNRAKNASITLSELLTKVYKLEELLLEGDDND